MDRTADFRRLVTALGGAPTADAGGLPDSAFVKAAGELRKRLAQLRRDLQYEGGQPSDIQACKDSMSALEALVEDVADLGDLAPPLRRRQDLLNFRRGVVQSLYEDLRDLASRVQTEQMQEMRHESEVSSFFTSAASPSASSRCKPPPLPVGPPLGLAAGTASGGAEEIDGDASASLQAEEQELLAAFETNLDQINQVKQKLGEVATMVSVFATKAEEQQEVAAQILEDAEVATQHVEDAGKHLQKANDNKSSYNFYIVCWFMGSGLFLLVFDYIDSRYSWI